MHAPSLSHFHDTLRACSLLSPSSSFSQVVVAPSLALARAWLVSYLLAIVGPFSLLIGSKAVASSLFLLCSFLAFSLFGSWHSKKFITLATRLVNFLFFEIMYIKEECSVFQESVFLIMQKYRKCLL